MKIVKIFGIVSLLFLLNSSLSTSYKPKYSVNDQNLSNSVCKIINEIIKSRTAITDIFIGNLGGQSWSSTINDITKCINDGIAIVTADMSKKITEKTLRKASVIILFLNDADQVCMVRLVLK